jgi:plasmid stabilization system protein ParE
VANVEFARTAIADLDRLVVTHSLPSDTRQRVRATLTPLQQFPRLGPELTGRWQGMRFLLGPWRWMILVYTFDEPADRIVVVTTQDVRSTGSAIIG